MSTETPVQTAQAEDVEVELGSTVRDVITGITGVAVSRTDHLYACAHIGVQPTDRTPDGGRKKVEFFEVQQLVVEAPPTAEILAKRREYKPTFELGSTVKDAVTGEEGVAVTRTTFMFADPHVGIQPTKLDKDGNKKKAEFYDEPQLIFVSGPKKELNLPKTKEERTGGPSLYGYPE